MTAHLNRRAATVIAATLTIGALFTATAGATWATPATAPSANPAVVTDDDGDVNLTLDPARVEALCAKAPAAQQQIADLIARIHGDEDVAGSVAALTQRAETARAAGREAAAGRLEARATRRESRVQDLERAAVRIAAAEATVCTSSTGTAS
ncbi:hypothetical protein [Pengzhenrongella sicca]|uniref:Secreted protein n=1 Tax=Pengzhenrongella sicca TaxID=2819238 RepID=A0A8A4ZCS2_9MICO|nr:hypothetical protein [Pengzhenrongella sicca]QTE29732.1 hypothetical protein J4E96_01385 [Pengzhenrongella sicca]